MAWGALGVLLLDLSCARTGAADRAPLVLLDGSLSMTAAGGRWAEARDSAHAWGEVRLFGDAIGPGDSLPVLGRSALAPTLRAAAASDRPVIVVSDGEVDDPADVTPELLARAACVIGIPIYGVNHSLPVAVAAGIVLHEWARRHFRGVR